MGHLLKICSLEELKRDHYRVIEVEEKRVAVYFHDQEVYAFEDQCTHHPCPLSGGPVVDDEIICMMHGARFNIKNGEVTMPPARRSLQMFSVVVRAGEVLLEV